jgi:hypothetical protein
LWACPFSSSLLGAFREQSVADNLDTPTGNRVQRGRAQSLAGAKAKAGMVHRTAHGFAHNQAFDERRMVMRAKSAYGEQRAAIAKQDCIFCIDAPKDHPTIRQRLQRNPASQIQTWSVFHVSHEILPLVLALAYPFAPRFEFALAA